VIRSFTRHKGPISAIQFRPIALPAATRNTETVAITAHAGSDAAEGIETTKPNGDTEMNEEGDAADAAGSPDSYGSLFGDEEEDDGSGKKQDKPIPVQDAATSLGATQSVAPSALPLALQLPPTSQPSSVQAQLPPSRPGILSAGLKGQPRVGLPPLVPETYRQFSDDVMLVASMDGEVALHDRRIGSSLVGKLEGSLKSGPWCMSVSVDLYTTGSFLYLHHLTIALSSGVFLCRWHASDSRPKKCLLGCLGCPKRRCQWDEGNAKFAANITPSCYITVGQRGCSFPGWQAHSLVSGGVLFDNDEKLIFRAFSASVDCVRLWNTADLWNPESNMKKSKSGVPFRIVAGHHGGTVSKIRE